MTLGVQQANIGFDFTFYGNVFQQFTIGSNGIISFNMANAGGYCPWSLDGTALPSGAITATHNSYNACLSRYESFKFYES
jgi:hypothetical protein